MGKGFWWLRWPSFLSSTLLWLQKYLFSSQCTSPKHPVSCIKPGLATRFIHDIIPRGRVWGGKREEGSGWGTHVHLWLIHVNVWQNPPQHCKVISLQLIFFKKVKRGNCFFKKDTCNKPSRNQNLRQIPPPPPVP